MQATQSPRQEACEEHFVTIVHSQTGTVPAAVTSVTLP